jgi:hypothetical protein
LRILCEASQVDAMAGWHRSSALWSQGAERISGVLLPGVKWSRDPSTFTDGRLRHWEERLRTLAGTPLAEADHVISDNLAGVLAIRPDAVLMGSFLWSDILLAAHPVEPEVMAFAQRERDLLDEHRPVMLCVADLVMPGVCARTQAVLLPWMCEPCWEAPRGSRSDEGPRALPGRPRVAVLGGATGAARDALEKAVLALRAASDWDLVVDPDVNGGALASCQLAICRPGAGTVTDCVAYGLPMVLVYEPGNPEMRHIAGRLAELGVARDIGFALDAASVVTAVAGELVLHTWEARRRRLQLLPRDGLERAVDWLETRFFGEASQPGDRP